MKDTHLIYLILAYLFNEFDEGKLLKKILSLSKRSDEEIKEFLLKIKPVNFDEEERGND